MTRWYSFLFTCFWSMVLLNQSDRKLQRAVYGMTFTCLNFAIALVYFLATLLDLQLNANIMGILVLAGLYVLYKFNLQYFSNKLQKTPNLLEQSSGNSKKLYITLGCVFFIGSFFLVGISGYYLVKHSKLLPMNKYTYTPIFVKIRS